MSPQPDGISNIRSGNVWNAGLSDLSKRQREREREKEGGEDRQTSQHEIL